MEKIDRLFKASLAAYIQSKRLKRLEQPTPVFRTIQPGRGGYQPFRSHYQNQSGGRIPNQPSRVYNRALQLQLPPTQLNMLFEKVNQVPTQI